MMMFNQEKEWSEIVGWCRPPDGFSESEQLLSAFFAASNVGFAVIDSQFTYQAINKTLAQMNGFPAEAHLGRSMRDILGSAAGPIEPILHRVLLTGKPVTNAALTLRLPTRTEVGHWVVHYFPMTSTAGKVTRIGVVVVEVTEQKRLEEMLGSQANQLQREKERRHALLEISTALNSTSDLHHAFSYISASVRKIMPHDWTGLSILEEPPFFMRTYLADCPLHPSLAGPACRPPSTTALVARRLRKGSPRCLTARRWQPVLLISLDN
jgi:PAS domain S-box-containing protein